MGQHIFHTQKGTITPSSGTATASLTLTDGVMKQLFIKPATSTTTYDVKLTDLNSLDVYEEQDVTGTLSDLTEFPIYGNMTLTIFNASADEAFQYLLVSKER